MSVDDYESLPETSKFTTHMLAGAAAGIMEHCIMYPVDCIKVGDKFMSKIVKGEIGFDFRPECKSWPQIQEPITETFWTLYIP